MYLVKEEGMGKSCATVRLLLLYMYRIVPMIEYILKYIFIKAYYECKNNRDS